MTNTEPQGIKDIREAKANYLDALANLRAADAELVKAQAALTQAEAATEQAVAAYNQAIAEAKQIENEIQKARNEKEAEELKAKIDSIKAKVELDAVKAEKKLAKAQANLEEVLREIAAKSIGLTGAEKEAITSKTAALNWAHNVYNWKLKEYNDAAKALWEAEYNVAAGEVGYETAESYKEAIAEKEKDIAKANKEIASLEALKEHPQAVKDSLDVLDAQIAAIVEQIFLSQSDKVLYESTPEFADAKKEFEKRVTDFGEDSLKGGDTFKYVDKDKKAIKYPLTNGKGLDKDFQLYVNEAVKDKNNKTASGYGIVVDKDAKNIEVGKIGSGYASKKQLDSAQALLKEIIDALDRHLVVVHDTMDAHEYKVLVEKANTAKKQYLADRDTLEKGLAAYAPYKAANDTVKMYQDTVKKAQTDSLAAEKKKSTDSVDVVKKAIDKAKSYRTSIEKFVAALNEGIPSDDDEKVAFIDAVKKLGAAQAAYIGKQDSVKIKRSYKTPGGTTGEEKYYVVFSELDTSDFAKNSNLYALVKKAAGCESTIKPKNVAESILENTYSPTGAFVYVVKDTLKFVIDTAKGVGAKKLFEDDIKAIAAAKKAVEDANEKLDAKKELAQKAQNAFAKVYNRFWGIDDTPKLQGAKDDPFPLCESLKKWTDSTFFSPENCVKFSHVGGETILPNNALKIVLDRVDSKDNEYSQGKDVNASSIFKNDKLTEFAEYILAAQYADEASNYKFLDDQFKNIKAQVAAIKKDVDAAYAAWEVANKGLDAVKARFYGVDKDGDILTPASLKLEKANVDSVKGKWTFGGYLLKWAEELAPEYPEVVKEATTKAKELREDQKNLVKYRFTLDWIFTVYSDFFENPDYASWNVQGIIKQLEDAIDEWEDKIDGYKDEIKALNKSIAECEAGYSNAEIKVNYWKSVLAQKERALEQAAEALARAQKEYDEVIAAYGVKAE